MKVKQLFEVGRIKIDSSGNIDEQISKVKEKISEFEKRKEELKKFREKKRIEQGGKYDDWKLDTEDKDLPRKKVDNFYSTNTRMISRKFDYIAIQLDHLKNKLHELEEKKRKG